MRFSIINVVPNTGSIVLVPTPCSFEGLEFYLDDHQIYHILPIRAYQGLGSLSGPNTFPQFYWQMCLFNLQLSVGFYSRTTVDISQSAPACCKTAVFTLFEHILPQELKVLYWLVQSGDERRTLVKTILFHLDDK